MVVASGVATTKLGRSYDNPDRRRSEAWRTVGKHPRTGVDRAFLRKGGEVNWTRFSAWTNFVR